jgi:aminoglycoside phosphotransferase (APT) family kinase protein
MSEELEPKRTSRDLSQLDEQLSKWFQREVTDSGAFISDLRRPTGSGMSSETLLFAASWDSGKYNENRQLVARLAPTPEDIPVFPSYDLDLQVQTMRLVRERTSIPTPRVLWLEKDPEILGVPFFVMEQLHGRVPPDIPPYVFGGWLQDAPAEDQQLLEERSVELIVELSKIDLNTVNTEFLENGFTGKTHLRRHFAAQRDYYQWVVGNTREHPVIERAFSWLEDNWPEESPTVLSWGDARIGNIMFGEDSFSPVAAFDWEMAGLAPVEVDLGWMVFLHKFFQNIAESFEFIGMPHFMEADNVRRIFAQKAGYIPDDLHWFMVYAGLRHAIIMSRINDRSVRFGQAEWTDDVDEAIPHTGLLWTMMEEK